MNVKNSLNPHHNKQTRSPSRELQETYSECRKLCTFRTMHGQITRNLPTIFRFEQWEMEHSNFTANCAKIAQFATLINESCEIHAILVKSYQSLLPNCTPTFLQQISWNSLNSRILRANDTKLTNFALISTNLLFYFTDSRKTGSSTLLARIMWIQQP